MTRKNIQCKIESLVVAPGHINAKVSETRSRPYETEIYCRQWDQSQWKTALNILSSEAFNISALVNGELPTELEAKFTLNQLELKAARQEWSYSCTCAETIQPCIHNEAVYSAFMDRVDHEPLLFFIIRGMDKEQLMSQLRMIRSVKMKEIVKNEEDPKTDSDTKSFSAMADGVTSPVQPAEKLLTHVKDPEFWTKDKTLLKLLQPVYKKVGHQAEHILGVSQNKTWKGETHK
jgi:uncharacterized Zn finger protein